MARAFFELLAFFAWGCSFPPIDHEGQPPPCAAGYVEVAGRCVRPRDGSAGRDAGVSPDGCSLACDEDVLVRCDGRVASICSGTSTTYCDRGTLVTVACPAGCSEGVVPSCSLDSRLRDVVPDDLRDRPVEVLRVFAGTVVTIDTMTGEIRADGRPVRKPGFGLLDGIDFARIENEANGVGAFYVHSMRVEGTLRAIGPAALSIAAQTQIAIEENGVIDLSADGVVPGAGGYEGGEGRVAGGCPSASTLAGEGPLGGSPGQGEGAEGASGGGGGGGSRGGGGDGAPGASACASEGAGGGEMIPNNVLAGGSGGGAGGDPIACDGTGPNARGGAGGGALHLFAYGRIVHLGLIDAGGGGGAGGGACGGGGGGGAGGAVWIDTPLLDLRAGSLIAVNGGGGGGGGARECVEATMCTPPIEGAAGGDGDASVTAAVGGASDDAPGGAGSDDEGATGTGTTGAFNGGGGGGGPGVIYFHTGMFLELGRTSPAIASGLVTLDSIYMAVQKSGVPSGNGRER
jgi:hypothetical protein